MKKFSILLLATFAMAVTSCDEAPEVPPMQSNPQEPILAAGDISGEAYGVLTESGVFNLETALGSVDVVKFTQEKDLPEGAKLTPVLQLSNNEDFTTVENVALAYNDETEAYAASSDAWNEAHIALFGKSPKEKTAYYRVPLYITLGGTEYRYDNPNYYVISGSITETCKDAGFTISQNYYLIGQQNDWALTQEGLDAYKFKHSDQDVYDDPVFTLVVTVPDNCYWKIVPQEAIPDQNWNALYGPATDGDTAFEGMLFEGGGSGEILEGGKYIYTINMEEMSYTIVPVKYPEYLCTPGGSNGWNQLASNWLPYVESHESNMGAAVLDGDFKLTDGNTWADDKTWGLGSEAGLLSQPGGNIPAGHGLYWIEAKTAELTYNLTEITSVGLIGGFNNWGAQENLTPSDDFYKWTGKVTIPEGNSEWKIRMNDDWGMNYGGSFTDMVFDGPNFNYAGTFTITVDFSGNYPVITVE